MVLCVALAAATICSAYAQERGKFFDNSYALVVGIDSYAHAKWPELNYAVKDARGFAEFLRSQGFTVFELYEKQATKGAILSAIEDKLIPRLTQNDRVVVFFAGHGDTRMLSGTEKSERGYLVPADGTDAYGSLIPVNQLQDLSGAMGAARHQLFVLDSCFGGLASMRASAEGGTIDPRVPDYAFEVTRRRARQLLTAGGANQRVRDGGPDGHSYFTGQLLKALREGIADKNGDGYITFSELSSYIQVAASSYNQTPGTDFLAGHEQGDYLFVNPSQRPSAGTGTTPTSHAAADVYELLKAGKKAFVDKKHPEARRLLLQAADLGNAEAMVILAKLYCEGWGGPIDWDAGLRVLIKAGDRGNLAAIENLADLYSGPGPFKNPAEGRRWTVAHNEARRLEASLKIFDPSGNAGSGEPVIPPSAMAIAAPAGPTSLRISAH